MIRIEQLSFRYPGSDRDALTGVTLPIERGSLFGLLGPNGAGKTTLVSILAGLLAPTAGRVVVGGVDLPGDPSRREASVGLVPQEQAFYPSLSAAENLAFFAGIHGLAGKVRKQRLDSVIERTRISPHLHKRASALSGGLRRRLNIAIGLLNEPEILFMDEPTVGIDPQSRHFIFDAIREINRQGATIVYTSHYLDEVQDLCDQVAIIDDGQIVCRGRLPEILEEHDTGTVSVRLSRDVDEPLLTALAGRAGVEAEGAHLRVALDGPEELDAVLEAVRASHHEIRSLSYGHDSLESLFLALTQRALRE